MNKLALLLLNACVALAWAPDLGAQAGGWSLDEYLAKKHKKNFADWNGIVFLCFVPEDANAALKTICNRAYTNVDFLAATSKVKLVKAKNHTDWYLHAYQGGMLLLEVDVYATKRGSPTAIHVALRASTSYENAIHQSGGGEGPRRLARAGDLIMWQNSATAASTGDGAALVDSVTSALEQLMKQFFTDYIKARQ